MALSFSFEGIQYGWLFLGLRIGKKQITWSCDEALSDPVPGMIRMYNALKNRQNATWDIERGGLLSFETIFTEDKDIVTLKIFVEENFNIAYADIDNPKEWDIAGEDNYDFDDGDYEVEDIIGEATFAVGYLMSEFEKFFIQLLTSKHYPAHYPCHSCHDHDEYKKLDEEMESYLESHGNNYPDFIQVEMQLSAIDSVRIKDESIEYFKKYDNMLKTMSVPEGW